MSSMTSWGRSNCFPVRENRALFKGFQNPRNPSYFSNTHLIRHWSVKQDGWDVMGVKNYQLVGLMEELVKKQALMGSPISSTSLTCLSKNPGGGESLMGIPSSTFNIVWIRSGRCNLMLAAKLCVFVMLLGIGMKRWWRWVGLPFTLSVPPARNSDQSDSFLGNQGLFQLISVFYLLQRNIGIWSNFKVVMPLLHGID